VQEVFVIGRVAPVFGVFSILVFECNLVVTATLKPRNTKEKKKEKKKSKKKLSKKS